MYSYIGEEGKYGGQEDERKNGGGCGLIKVVVGIDISWNWWNAMAL
jgi:hypothetical protein